VQYALRLKGKDSKVVTSQKKGNVASSSIAVDGSDSDGQSSNTNKSLNVHVEKMVDLSKKVGGSLSCSTAGASIGNTEVNMGLSEGSADTGSGACPRQQTLCDKAEEYFVEKQQAKFPDDSIPF